ncbi:protein kinase domain-containing protein [Candidatus Leptofilum sp.]|uniref:serine/threonine-protein kinase n=1 Tax=Candidatus Leptofilum sp. TaxID=3241576 RepID=UPI003B5932F4
MKNPYISRGPIQDKSLFFGRHYILQEIGNFLQGNQSVSVVGPRKIGKTSLFFHLLRPETVASLNFEHQYLFVYLDCEVLGDSNHQEIFGIFASEMEIALEEQGFEVEPTLERAIAHPTRISFETAVRKLNRRGIRIVIILDEFERLSANPKLNVNFFNALRSAAGRFQLIYLTASTKPLIQLTYVQNQQEILSSPFFNIFAQLHLGLFSREEAFQLINTPAQEAGNPFTAEMASNIYQLAGGHPFVLQIVSFFAFSNDDEQLEERIWQELLAHYEYYWRNLSLLEQSTLLRLSQLIASEEQNTTIASTLRDLTKKCLIVELAGRHEYFSKSWQLYVSRQQMPDTPNKANGAFTGTHIAPYEIGDLLGRGGMSEVYKGVHVRLGKPVAIKVLPSTYASKDDFRTRFQREAQAVARLNHPNIVQVFDFGDFEGAYYMVMDLIDGKDLMAYLADRKPLSIEQTLVLGKDIATALDYAHSQGIVHRDIKPSNILLRQTDDKNENWPFQCLLTDFGVAKIRQESTNSTKTGGILGTLNYMAPEQIRQTSQVTHLADIYALGVVLYRALTGQLPFGGENFGSVIDGHLHQVPPDPRKFNSEISDLVANALLKSLAKEPKDRFETAASFIASISQ